jgi:nucleotide-binding universal stress UspA family protein
LVLRTFAETEDTVMTTTQKPAGRTIHQSWEYERLQPGGIVVGVDGSSESIAALNTAAAIAKAHHWPLHVISVLSPLPSYQIDPGLSESRNNTDELRIQLRSASVRDLMECACAEEGWTHEVVMGRPARMITQVAASRGANLIVVGRREHGLMDRITGAETPLKVMRLSSIPVLAVASDVTQPQSIVVATDFSEASITAAKAACELLGRRGSLHLVYVEPPLELLPEGFAIAGDGRYPGDVVQWFRRLVEAIKAPPGVFVETTLLNGKPVPAVVEFADRIGADMIAAGAHSHSRMERMLLGSVSTGLVRNARCPVLIAPVEE